MLFFYLLGESLSQIITEGRKCPDVPVIPDFTLGKVLKFNLFLHARLQQSAIILIRLNFFQYAGEWHQQIRYPVRYSDPNGKCGQGKV